MNGHDIQRVAAAFNVLRPDWPTKQLATLLADERITHRPRRDVVVALSWVACESDTASPYRVLEAGPWWRAVAVEGSVSFQPLAATERCQICGRSELDCSRNPFAGHEFRPDIRRPSGIDVHRTIEALKAEAAS